MAKETMLGKHFNIDDEQLPWVYAQSEDSGGIFGLEQDCLMSVFQDDVISISYAKHTYRVMPKTGLVKKPAAIAYTPSYGDGSSHGATWGHFAEITRSLTRPDIRELDDRAVELCLDGLQNMALEGAHSFGGSWLIVHEGLVDARNDLLDNLRYRQGALYEGLGWLATNFAEQEAAAMRASVEA